MKFKKLYTIFITAAFFLLSILHVYKNQPKLGVRESTVFLNGMWIDKESSMVVVFENDGICRTITKSLDNELIVISGKWKLTELRLYSYEVRDFIGEVRTSEVMVFSEDAPDEKSVKEIDGWVFEIKDDQYNRKGIILRNEPILIIDNGDYRSGFRKIK